MFQVNIIFILILVTADGKCKFNPRKTVIFSFFLSNVAKTTEQPHLPYNHRIVIFYTLLILRAVKSSARHHYWRPPDYYYRFLPQVDFMRPSWMCNAVAIYFIYHMVSYTCSLNLAFIVPRHPIFLYPNLPFRVKHAG